MDGQAVAGKPLGQHRHDLAGVRFQFAADDKIIGKADQETSSLQAWLDLMLKPCIEDLMEKDIGQHGGMVPPCTTPVSGWFSTPSSQTPARSHFPIRRIIRPSLTLWRSTSRSRVRSILSKYPLTSASTIQPIPSVMHRSRNSCSASWGLRPGRKPYEPS